MVSKVCVFVDVGNQFYCINKKWPGRKLNYEIYMGKCTQFGEIARAFAYGTQVENSASKFISCLHHIGYEPNYRTVEKNSWYSWDVGISIDIVRQVAHDKCDVIIIGNSNRTIVPVIMWAKERGVRVIIMACGINVEVREACDQWIEIKDDMLEQQLEEVQEVEASE